MGKDMIIKILQDQLEAANATILQLNLTVSNLNGTVNELNERIVSLEALLKERDASLTKAQNQMRGLSKLVEKKSEQHPGLLDYQRLYGIFRKVIAVLMGVERLPAVTKQPAESPQR